jgi:hypothetical protein
MKRTLAIDFDGTICKKQPYGNGIIYETPNDGAIEKINKLFYSFRIVIFTTRLNPDLEGDLDFKREQIVKWLEMYQIKYDELTNNKPQAFAYIDDRAIRFTNWQDITNYFI